MRQGKRLLQKICRFAYYRWRLLLCVCAAAGALTAAALTAFAAKDLNQRVESLALLNGGQPVVDNDILSLNTTVLTMQYELWDIHVDTTGTDPELYFFDTATTWDTSKPIQTGVDYELKLPEYLQCAAAFPDIPIQAGNVTIATVSYVDKDTVKLRFADDIIAKVKAAGSTHIQSPEFRFSATLDATEVGKRNEVTIDLGNNQTVTVEIAENAPKHAMLNDKSCSNSAGEPKIDPATGHFHWTVVIDPETPVSDVTTGSPVYTQGYVFKDALGTAQTYVDGTFTITWARSTPVIIKPLMTPNANNELEYIFTDDLDAPVTITYETEPADGLFYDDANKKMIDPASMDVNNTATLYMPGPAGAEINSKGGTAEYEGKEWLTKTGVDIDRLNKTITWTLTVNTNGRGFNYIKVYDEFGGGSDPSAPGYLAYVPNSLKVDGVTTPTATGFNGHDENLLYELNDPTKAEYELSYQTTFSNISLDDNLGKSASNSAWLDFEWKTGHGPGPGDDYGIPTVNKPVSLGASIVAKSGVYNPATKQIKWTLTVNANRLDVTSATIEDRVTLTNQGRILDTPVPSADCTAYTGAKPNYKVTMTEIGLTGVYTVVLDKGTGDNHLDTDTVVITYYTEAKDPAFYANNATEFFHNTATVKDIVLAGSPQTPLGPFSVTADPTGTSRVLDKDAVGYDFDANQIEWKLTVNANKMSLTGATVTDVLPPYLSFVQGSATYTPADSYPPLTYSNNTLTFPLGDINGQVTINFKVELDVDATTLPGGFRFGGSNTADGVTAPLSIDNSASLVTNEYAGGTVTEAGDIDITNTLLNKQGTPVSATPGLVQYTIELNQNGADLSLVYPSGAFLTDALPGNLFVDLEEVHLYEASVDASTGAFTQGAEVPLTYAQKQLVLPNNLRVELPNVSGRYILKYDAYIIAGGGGPVSLVNSAGFGPDGTSGGQSITTSATASSGGSASLIPGKSALKITKTDAHDPTLALPGAVYGLYAPIPNSQQTYLFQVATTALDNNGDASATFVGLTPGRDYMLVELTAPPGYALAAPMPVTGGAVQTVLVLPVQDVKRSAIGGAGGVEAEIPSAGDGAQPWLWAGLLLLCAAGLCVSRGYAAKDG